MDLAVVIINWNTRELLAQCLRSVQTALGGAPCSRQIVVVDSASSDDSAAMVRRDFPAVTLLELAANRGFGAAANAGMRLLAAPHLDGGERSGLGGAILLLNADTAVEGPAIQEMLAYLEVHPRVGVVGPQLRYPDGQVQPSRRRFPTPGTLFWESTVLEQYWPRNPWAHRYHMADRSDDAAQEVDWLVGAGLLVRAEALAQAGPLDEGYFLYFEELEWCRRIGQAGWQVVYLPTAHITHHEGRSTEQVPLQRHLHFGRSKVRYARQAFGAGWAACLRAFLLAACAWQWLIEAAKWLLGHRRALRRERMRIYAAVLEDGLGAKT